MVNLSNFDNLSDLDLTKIPTGLRNQVTDFLTTGRQKYYDASEKAANARMGSEEYRNAVREMNNVNNTLKSLNARNNLPVFSYQLKRLNWHKTCFVRQVIASSQQEY